MEEEEVEEVGVALLVVVAVVVEEVGVVRLAQRGDDAVASRREARRVARRRLDAPEQRWFHAARLVRTVACDERHGVPGRKQPEAPLDVCRVRSQLRGERTDRAGSEGSAGACGGGLRLRLVLLRALGRLRSLASRGCALL